MVFPAYGTTMVGLLGTKAVYQTVKAPKMFQTIKYFNSFLKYIGGNNNVQTSTYLSDGLLKTALSQHYVLASILLEMLTYSP